MPLSRRGNSTLGSAGLGHVAGKADSAEFVGRCLGRRAINVEQRDLGAGVSERHRGCPAQPRRAATDQRGHSQDLHAPSP
jgi:hypothetical protein